MRSGSMKKTWRFGFALVLAFGMFVGAGAQASAQLIERSAYVKEATYQDYLAKHPDAASPPAEIVIWASDYRDADEPPQRVAGLGGLDGIALVTGETGYVEWEVDVETAGMYNIEVMYYPVPGRSTSMEREIQVNGETPFGGAQSLFFSRVWADESPVRRDSAGNEVRPRQVEVPSWQTVQLQDALGYVQEPYKFYFHEGINTIRLVSRAEPMALAYLKLHQAPRPPTYEALSATYAARGYQPAADVFVKIQGEDAFRKSSPALFAIPDTGDPTLEPYHPAQLRLNSIGGFRWQQAGEWITWEFEVPVDGLYQIAIKGKQNRERGLYSSRTLLIDGQVPFEEALAIRFPFSDRYIMKQVGDGEAPRLVYLTAGKHTLTLVVSLGDLANLLDQMEQNLYALTTIYRSIIMITSANPDPFRSYQLEQRIPDLLDELRAMSETLDERAADFEAITGERGGHTAALRDLARLLRRMADQPHRIQRVLGEYRDGIGALGNWIMLAKNQPLQIDYIVVASPDAELPRATPTFFEALLHEARAFFASFTHDYTGISSIVSEDDLDESGDGQRSIKVWIGEEGWGRDQAQVLKEMIEDSFTPQTGIRVDLELITGMGNLLIPALIAGTGPDVAIGALNMDFAFRGAVADLTQFDDFEEVARRFKKSALLNMRFRDKVYGLPETQQFPVLFYRKDILAELGLSVPQTWDDVLAIIPELKKRHMDFGIQANMNSFLTLLYQQGVPLFQEDMIATNLESEASIRTFERMTDFYTLYGLLIEYNFENRFRMGEMPLAIAPYGEYNRLAVFAPELRGEWGFTLIPGTRQPDGSVVRTAPGNSSGAIILEQSSNKAEAWEFLKWWTSADAQHRFGRELESLLGAAARYATANVEAMERLPWRASEREILLEQWDWIEGTPPVLGGYYVTRMFDWLFRAVVLDNQPVRESVIDYNREINKEIARKREEFGYETDPDQLDDVWKRLYWEHYSHLDALDVDPPQAAIALSFGTDTITAEGDAP